MAGNFFSGATTGLLSMFGLGETYNNLGKASSDLKGIQDNINSLTQISSLKASEKTKELYNRVMPVFLRHSNRIITQSAESNFVIEMTGKNIFSIKDLLIRTKKKGFRIVAVLVQTDLKKALFNNKNRARKVPERAIIETYKELESNFKFVVSSGEVDEAWVINNTDTPTYKQFRSSKYIKKIK